MSFLYKLSLPLDELLMTKHNLKGKIFLGKCGNTNGNATDKNGDGCDAYTNGSSSRCGLGDDEDFDSQKMCCNCGGGGVGNSVSVLLQL